MAKHGYSVGCCCIVDCRQLYIGVQAFEGHVSTLFYYLYISFNVMYRNKRSNPIIQRQSIVMNIPVSNEVLPGGSLFSDLEFKNL